MNKVKTFTELKEEGEKMKEQKLNRPIEERIAEMEKTWDEFIEQVE